MVDFLRLTHFLPACVGNALAYDTANGKSGQKKRRRRRSWKLCRFLVRRWELVVGKYYHDISIANKNMVNSRWMDGSMDVNMHVLVAR